MPTGSPVSMATAGGSRAAGMKDSTLNAPVARICARLLRVAAVLFLPGSEDPSEWVPALTAALPGTPVYTVEDAFAPEEVQIAIVAPSGGDALRGLPRLRLVQSLWMGVDRLGPVPAGVSIARMVDPGMTTAMPEAALAHVLHLHRFHDVYARQQRAREWRQWPQPLPS